jgi:hypothetical protein
MKATPVKMSNKTASRKVGGSELIFLFARNFQNFLKTQNKMQP